MSPKSLPNNITTLEKLVGKLDKLDKLMVKAYLDAGSTVLHWAISEKPSVLGKIFDALPEEDRPLAAKALDKEGHSVIGSALEDPASLKIVLNHFPNHELRDVLLDKINAEDETLMHRAAWLVDEQVVHGPSALKLFLDFLPPADRLSVLQARSKLHPNMLFSAADNPIAISTILYSLNEKDRVILVAGGVVRCGLTSYLDRARLQPNLLKIVLDSLPKGIPFETILTGGLLSNPLSREKRKGLKVSNEKSESLTLMLDFVLGTDERILRAYRLLDEKLGFLRVNDVDQKWGLIQRLRTIAELDNSEQPILLARPFFSSPPPYVEAMSRLTFQEQRLVAAVLLEERHVAYHCPGERPRINHHSNYSFYLECLAGVVGISLFIAGLMSTLPVLTGIGMGLVVTAGVGALYMQYGFFSNRAATSVIPITAGVALQV